MILYWVLKQSERMKMMNSIYLDARRTLTENPSLDDFHMHTHDFYEIYCFISGNAKYYVEGNIYNLKSGDILFIKKSEAHTLQLTSEADYERAVVNFNADAVINEETQTILSAFDGLPLGKGNRFPFSQFKNKHWHHYIDKMLSSDNEEIKRLYLSVLINEMFECSAEALTLPTVQDTSSDIIAYLNQNITAPMTLESICNKFYISKSQLNRKFKRMTGSTVWEYITAKRLILAKDLLQHGESPTTVYTKCGFNDYTTFYRAYKAKFSVSPKNHYIQ